MTIDAHTHIFLSKSDDPERSVDELAPADREAPLELLEQHMAAAGVDGAVLVPLGPEDGYVAQVLAGAPQRFAGIAVARAHDDDPGLVSERLARGGFAGLRMFGLPGRLEDRPRWLPVVQRLAADGRVLWLYPRAEDLSTVDAIAAQLPDLTIVLNHCGFTQAGIGRDEYGRPKLDSAVPQPHEGRVHALAQYRNVAVVLSGAYAFSAHDYPYPDVAGVVGRIADAFGVDRLAWASDFPWIVERPGYRACLDLVDEHLPGLSPAEREAVVDGNIRRLLQWSSS